MSHVSDSIVVFEN